MLIDELRALLGTVRGAEYPELVGFEACMLNWEAVLKLNRASFLDDNRAKVRRAGSGIRGLNKRASLYAQHSPSTASDELDDNVIINGGDSQVSENDSGIDSLRQHISPYYHSSQQTSQALGPMQLSGAYNGNTGMAQRRFKQFKERRKSLGIVLDGDSNRDYDRLAGNGSASGHLEVDDCLKHHLYRAIDSLKWISTRQGTPFEFTLTEMLSRMEQDTIALEMLLNIADSLPNMPNVYAFLAELGAGNDVRDIWISACFQVKFAMVSTESIEQRMHIFLQPIVEARYPKLVLNVLQALMGLLCQGWDPSKVSIFQFVSLFRGKHLSSFVENLSHEAWITSNLMSSQPNAVREVMNRLRNVPVVPPLESLRI
uniref:Uncharacterized protein n=1 Tax=Ditylenchus dipsaci TaxID=166011 RepID=A0A915DZP6_9BILA